MLLPPLARGCHCSQLRTHLEQASADACRTLLLTRSTSHRLVSIHERLRNPYLVNGGEIENKHLHAEITTRNPHAESTTRRWLHASLLQQPQGRPQPRGCYNLLMCYCSLTSIIYYKHHQILMTHTVLTFFSRAIHLKQCILLTLKHYLAVQADVLPGNFVHT